MLVVFLDESHIKKEYLGRCGVALLDSQLLPLESAFREQLKAAGVPLDHPDVDTEVKWSPRQRNWIRKNLDDETRRTLYRNLLALLDKHNAKLIGAVFHYSRMKGWDVDRAHTESYKYVFERIEFHAQRLCQTALVIVDSEGGSKSTMQRVTETFNLVRSGSKYTQLKSIYKHVWPAKSERHAGIQLADLVVGITTRMVAGEHTYANEYWDLLQGRFMSCEKGDKRQPQQFGLQILPSNERKTFIKNHDPYGWNRESRT